MLLSTVASVVCGVLGDVVTAVHAVVTTLV